MTMLNSLNGFNSAHIPKVGGSSPIQGTLNTNQNSGVPQADFGQMLSSLVADTVDALGKSEATAMAGIQGKASVQQVVEAVMQAEQALHTALAVRDKVVGAYQEISRMSI
jgi:flagellar hook-basal body complex protein FliE